jgi:hypothetical protein
MPWTSPLSLLQIKSGRIDGDEVMAGKRLINGTDAVGPFIAARTQTRQSQPFFDLKLYILPCDLSVASDNASAAQPMSGEVKHKISNLSKD